MLTVNMDYTITLVLAIALIIKYIMFDNDVDRQMNSLLEKEKSERSRNLDSKVAAVMTVAEVMTNAAVTTNAEAERTQSEIRDNNEPKQSEGEDSCVCVCMC